MDPLVLIGVVILSCSVGVLVGATVAYGTAIRDIEREHDRLNKKLQKR